MVKEYREWCGFRRKIEKHTTRKTGLIGKQRNNLSISPRVCTEFVVEEVFLTDNHRERFMDVIVK